MKRPCVSSSTTRKLSCSPRMRNMPTGRAGRRSSGWWPCRNSALLSSRSAAMKLKLDGNFCDLLSAFLVVSERARGNEGMSPGVDGKESLEGLLRGVGLGCAPGFQVQLDGFAKVG